MTIQWMGHSSFRLVTKSGVQIVTDPYNEQVGYAMPVHGADIVTVSHGHFDHNHIGSLAPSLVADKTGTFEKDGVRIEGYPSWHDDEQGAKRGPNVLFVIEADGVRVLHLGDLGHDLTDEAIRALGRVDVLLIPVGGVFTIDAKQAAALAVRIGARVTVPMHFKTSALSFELGGVEAFTAIMGGAAEADTLNTDGGNSPVVVLKPGCGL